MSTFLSRLAAGAVGAEASARPRPAALFESAPASELVEMIEERVSSPSTPPARWRPPPSPAGADGQSRTASSPAARRTAPDQAGRRGLADQPGIEPIESLHHEVEVVPEGVETTAHSGPGRSIKPAVAAETPSRQAAAPALAAPNADFRQLPAPPAPAIGEQRPEVRVHIGRLDVRAELQQAPQPRPREPERAPELSLTDYLRGSRSA